MSENNFNANNIKKSKKTAAELKEQILLQKQKAIKEANRRIKELEKRERDARMKPYFKTVEKYINNISDKDLETMTNYVVTKFGNK
ncbi:MAG: hypothetical protein ACRCW5_04615 [Cetobacterium sp.]|uniref:hypothetical protein n=1 Tax=Cetobacterium sp. TaxID=2071632 RepID=UPI003F30E115